MKQQQQLRRIIIWLKSFEVQDAPKISLYYRNAYRILFLFAIFPFTVLYFCVLVATFFRLAIRKLSVKSSGSITSILVTNYRFQGYVLGVCNDNLAEYFASYLAKVKTVLFLLYG